MQPLMRQKKVGQNRKAEDATDWFSGPLEAHSFQSVSPDGCNSRFRCEMNERRHSFP